MPRLAKARKGERKLRRQLERAVQAGDVQRAAGLRRRYLRSFDARLDAAWVATKREARYWDDEPHPPDAWNLMFSVAPLPPQALVWDETSTPELPRPVARLDLRAPCDEPVRVSARPKKTGGYRPISSPGTERYARMRLAKRAMEPFVSAELRPEQYGVAADTSERKGRKRKHRRGRDACVAKVQELLQQRDSRGRYRYQAVDEFGSG
jgi:hypothetical protein